MKNAKLDLTEYKCFADTNLLALYGLLCFCVALFFGVTIAVIVCLINGMNFVPDGLAYLLLISLPSLILSIVSVKFLYGNKQAVFKINKEVYSFNGKFHGKEINIHGSVTDIKSIEIKDFSNTHRAIRIILVDDKGTYGNTAITKNGEYIKLRYTKKRLKIIQQFLPNCKVIYSNVTPDEV